MWRPRRRIPASSNGGGGGLRFSSEGGLEEACEYYAKKGLTELLDEFRRLWCLLHSQLDYNQWGRFYIKIFISRSASGGVSFFLPFSSSGNKGHKLLLYLYKTDTYGIQRSSFQRREKWFSSPWVDPKKYSRSYAFYSRLWNWIPKANSKGIPWLLLFSLLLAKSNHHRRV